MVQTTLARLVNFWSDGRESISAVSTGRFSADGSIFVSELFSRFSLPSFLPAIAHVSLEPLQPYWLAKYSATNFPVKPVAPHRIISNSRLIY